MEYVDITASGLAGITVSTKAGKGGGGCEDFTFMMKAVQNQGGQAVHMGIGADFGQSKDWSSEHKIMEVTPHSSRYDFDEQSLVYGSAMLAYLLLSGE